MGSHGELLSMYAGKKGVLPQTLSMDHVSGATRLLEKRRQMYEVQEALDAQKEEFARREDAFRRREEALRRKDLELQESLIKFNKFLQENESKRTRALKRAQDERRHREQKDKEIGACKVQYAEKMEEEKKMKRKEDENMKYHQYLSNVVDFASKDYAEIEEILSRHRVLKLANDDLLKRQIAAETEHDNLTVHYGTYAKERANEILNYSNEIASLQKILEKSALNVKNQQVKVDQSIRESSNKVQDLWQILGTVENLLERCEQGLRTKIIKARVEKKVAGAIDTEAEGKKAMEGLDTISTFMMDFKDITEEENANFTVAIHKKQQANLLTLPAEATLESKS